MRNRVHSLLDVAVLVTTRKRRAGITVRCLRANGQQISLACVHSSAPDGTNVFRPRSEEHPPVAYALSPRSLCCSNISF